jgi:hypothetical protein
LLINRQGLVEFVEFIVLNSQLSEQGEQSFSIAWSRKGNALFDLRASNRDVRGAAVDIRDDLLDAGGIRGHGISLAGIGSYSL